MDERPIDPNTNQSVFTFFSEFIVDWEGQAVIEAIVLSIIMVCAFTGNGMVILAVIRRPKMRKTTNYLICNLAATDMLFAAWIPFLTVTRITHQWIFGNVICKLVTYIQFVSGICSILTLMMISIERYITICLLDKRLTNFMAGLVICTTWILSVCFPVPIAVAQSEKQLTFKDYTFNYCGISWPDHFHIDVYLSFMVIFFFFIPLFVITINYYRIFRVVKISSAKTSRKTDKKSKRQIRLIKMFVGIVCAFVIMWLPFFIVSFLAVYLNIITSTQFTITLILALANTGQNPIIYGFFNTKFRKEFKWMCCCRKRKDGTAVARQYQVNRTFDCSLSEYANP